MVKTDKRLIKPKMLQIGGIMMQAQILIKCSECGGDKVKLNGKKANGKQLYKCKECNRQFIADHEKTYKGTISTIVNQIRLMMVRGSGVRDIAAVLRVSIYKVLATLTETSYDISPKKTLCQLRN